MATQLKYHQPIFDLLAIEPVLSLDRIAAIEERELVCGTRFPASVREWFALLDAEVLFRDNSNQDELEKLPELGNPEETCQGYLRVAIENQAVVAWYVRLTEGDDPPVCDNNDEWNDDLSETNWQPNSVTFSNFIFDTISNSYFRGWYSGMRLSATDSLPDEATLEQLRSWFRQGPNTDITDSKVYRFFTTQGAIAIWSVTPKDLANGTAEWSVEADSPESLLDFVQKLWNIGKLSQTLKAQSCSPESRAKGEEILQRLRADNNNK